MKTTKPKPLVELADKPLIQYSLDTAMKLNPERIILVTGYKKDEVKKYVLGNNPGDYVFCEQKERLGTGHAVKQAAQYLPESGKTIVLYSDVPLVSETTLKKLIKSSNRKKLSILTSNIKNPKGYGRIIRDEQDQPLLIREEQDATKEEKKINEIFSGIMIADNDFLKKGLKGLVRNNAAGEYYLTDLVEFASAREQKIGSTQTQEKEILGANNKQELGDLYRALVALNIASAKRKGAIFKDESTCYVEGPLKVGRDVKIGNNVTIKGEVILGNNVSIGSNTVLFNTKIGDETMVKDGSFDGLDVPLNRNMFIPAGQKWSRLEEVNALFITLGKKSPKWEETRKISPRWGEWTVAYNVLLHGKKQGYGGRNARKGTFYGERDRGFKTLNIAKDLCYMIEEIKIAKSLCKCLMSDYYDMMINRINDYQKTPPPENWDGVFVATSK